MQLKFTKMHGTGNDFVVIDLISQRCRLRPGDVRRIADRHFGIGCDQVLLVEPPGSPEADFRYRIFNADGNEVEQCGNGARCFARFVRDKKLTSKRIIKVETAAGEIELRMLNRSEAQVDMGVPRFEPGDIPLDAEQRQDTYQIEVDNEVFDIGAVSMGNPHAILRVDDVASAPVEHLGPLLEGHGDFPNRVNVSFLQVDDPTTARLRVFERGVGETLACGTGACAAVVHGITQGWLQDTVTVTLPGGKLSISWAGEGQPVIMTGPTAVVFEGTIKIQGAD